jgi:hypothetical protein
MWVSALQKHGKWDATELSAFEGVAGVPGFDASSSADVLRVCQAVGTRSIQGVRDKLRDRQRAVAAAAAAAAGPAAASAADSASSDLDGDSDEGGSDGSLPVTRTGRLAPLAPPSRMAAAAAPARAVTAASAGAPPATATAGSWTDAENDALQTAVSSLGGFDAVTAGGSAVGATLIVGTGLVPSRSRQQLIKKLDGIKKRGGGGGEKTQTTELSECLRCGPTIIGGR